MSSVNPTLLDFPDEFETERLIIRAPRPGDEVPLTEAVIESLDHLRPWMPWAKEPPTVEENKTRVRESAARWLTREDLWLMLVRKSDGLWVGGSGLHRADWDVPKFEIGYWVRGSLQGQGYVTEAVRGITDFAMKTLNAQRVEIRCDSRNTRSASVARRCGYVLEGKLRQDSRGTDGSLRDTLFFSLLRNEWEALQAQDKS